MKIFKLWPFIFCTIVVTGCTSPPAQTPPNPDQPESSTSQEDTSDWLVYKNDTYGYRINYHTEWKAQQPGEPPYPPPPEGMNFSRTYSVNPPEICGFEILASSIPDNFAGEIESRRGPDGDEEESATTLAGKPAILFSLSNEIQQTASYYLTAEGKELRVGYNIMRGDHFNDCLEVVEKMLASFELEN